MVQFFDGRFQVKPEEHNFQLTNSFDVTPIKPTSIAGATTNRSSKPVRTKLKMSGV
jgi:hypothetical protein